MTVKNHSAAANQETDQLGFVSVNIYAGVVNRRSQEMAFEMVLAPIHSDKTAELTRCQLSYDGLFRHLYLDCRQRKAAQDHQDRQSQNRGMIKL